VSIRRILDHLGLSPPEEAKPPHRDRLEQAKKQLAETQQTLADLEDEGRRNGYR
jgi:hypothetical protein